MDDFDLIVSYFLILMSVYLVKFIINYVVEISKIYDFLKCLLITISIVTFSDVH